MSDPSADSSARACTSTSATDPGAGGPTRTHARSHPCPPAPATGTPSSIETAWLSARRDHLDREKQFTRERDALSASASRPPLARDHRRLPVRNRRRNGHAGRTLRRSPPAPHLPLHDGPGLGGGLPVLLVLGRQLRRHRRPPGAPRHHPGCRFTCAHRCDRGLQATDGLDVHLGLLPRQPVQLRHEGQLRSDRPGRPARQLQLRHPGLPRRRGPRHQRLRARTTTTASTSPTRRSPVVST